VSLDLDSRRLGKVLRFFAGFGGQRLFVLDEFGEEFFVAGREDLERE
jgi:hypothetical protein